MKVSILSIGTELTTGQIINRNSAWIATRLKKYGVEPQAHLTVPDDRPIILDALQYCSKNTDALFITGGLGPTSDDFTRDMIAEWLKLKMKFDENSWSQINEILIQRGIQAREAQKQQCYFPEGSEILKNRKGTANGFSVQHKSLKVYVLPGPPLEIEAIWDDHIESWLQQKTRSIDKMITKSWDTMGHPESEIANITEKALADLKKDFPLTVGYRVHLPYVEVKISYPQSVEYTAQAFFQKVETALKPMTVLRDFEKAAEIFSRLTIQTPFAFYDFCTQGYLHQSLSPYLKKHTEWMWKQADEPMDSDFFSNEENFIAVWSTDEKTCQLMANFKGKNLSKTFEVPARFLTLPDRRAQYFAEMALIQFIQYYG